MSENQCNQRSQRRFMWSVFFLDFAKQFICMVLVVCNQGVQPP